MPSELSAARDDDSRGGPAQGVEVGLVAGDVDHVWAQQRVVPAAVVLGRETEVGPDSKSSCEVGRSRSPEAREGNELRHRRSKTVALIDLVDVVRHREGLLPIWENGREGRLVGDERADVFGMPGH